MPGMKRIALGMVGPGLVGGELLRQLEATQVQDGPPVALRSFLGPRFVAGRKCPSVHVAHSTFTSARS